MVFDGKTSGITETIDTRVKKIHDIQVFYQVQVGVTEFVVDVPTAEALFAGVVAHEFIVNFNERNPNIQVSDDTPKGEATITNIRGTPKGTEFSVTTSKITINCRRCPTTHFVSH